MELLVFVGSDKESWGQITGIVNHGVWDKIIAVKNAGGKDLHIENAEYIDIDTTKPLLELKEELQNKLKDKFSELEVCLSIASGNGKEHMALISALLSIPMGIRFVAFTKKGVEYIN